MNSELSEFYQTWSNKEEWLIDYDNEVAGRKVDAILGGMPELRDLGIKSVVDFGCGYGKTLYELSQRLNLEKAYGFDVSENAINYAQKHFASSGLQFHQLATLDIAENTQFIRSIAGSDVDAVLLIDLLEHRSGPGNLNKPISGGSATFEGPTGRRNGAEDGKESETDTLSGVQSQSGTGSDGRRQDAGRTGAAV